MTHATHAAHARDARLLMRAARSAARGLASRSAGVSAGLVAAGLPALARAAAGEGRGLEPSPDFSTVALVTVLTAGGILLLASLGRMYQRHRGIRWRFQDPDSPHDGGH